MLIDSHCHLGFPNLGGHTEETLKFLSNAKINNVGLILDISTDLSKFKEYLDFSNNIPNTSDYPKLYTAIGIHPLHIEENLNFSISDFDPYLKNEKLIAIGETGFDGYYVKNKFKIQRELFEIHANTAIKNSLPIIIHTRSAEEETIDAISYFVSKYNLTGVIHCFTGDLCFAKKLLNLGFYLSFSGITTFKNAQDIQQVVKYVPQDRILVETDAPYLAPVPNRGKNNEPGFVKYTYEYIANLRNEKLNFLEQYVEKNFYDLFNKITK